MFGRHGHVGPFTDPQVRDYATRVFQRELALDADADIRGIEREGDRVVLRYRGRDGAERASAVDFVIAATGRSAERRTAGAREHVARARRATASRCSTGIRCNAAIPRSSSPATSNDDLPLLHEAADEGRIAGENAARFPDVRAAPRRAPLAVVFSDPQLAVIGARHAELAPGSFVTGAVSFEDQGRSRVMLRNAGLLHVYADAASGRLLGAEMIGPDAEHIGHLLAWAVQAGFTVGQALTMPFYHPVVEEGLRTALRDAAARLAQARLADAA